MQTERLITMIEPEALATLKAAADKAGLPVSVLVRQAIVEYLATKQQDSE